MLLSYQNGRSNLMVETADTITLCRKELYMKIPLVIFMLVSSLTCEFILQKIQSWVQLPDGNWELGTVIQTTGNNSVITLPEGKVSNIFFLLS